MSIDLSLDRLVQLLPHLPYTRPTLHVAGTNGKGSVSALLTSLLTSASPPFRVGRFNSPHLLSVLDSITLNDTPITHDLYTLVRGQVVDADAAHGTKLTGFEILTMTALRVFEREQVDIVVLEVGMGGRLDATNVIPSETVLVSALAAVDLDHQAFLGDTVALIAREKAGIARRGKPFVLGNQAHREVEDVVREVVGAVGGRVVPAVKVEVVVESESREWSLLDETTSLGPPNKLVKATLPSLGVVQARLPLHGAHQLDNLGTALTVIDALLASEPSFKHRFTPQTIAKGVESVKWAGRLSFHTFSVPLSDNNNNNNNNVELLVLADGAHNPASAKTLGAYITELLALTASSTSTPTSLPITYILSLSHSPPKTPLQTLSPILPPTLPSSPSSSPSTITLDLGVALLPFSPPDGMPWIRTVPVSTLQETIATLVPDLPEKDIWVSPSPSSLEPAAAAEGEGEALKDAIRWAARRHVSSVSGRDEGTGEGTVGRGRGRGLVVLAGSLYLVADFYRLLSKGFLKEKRI